MESVLKTSIEEMRDEFNRRMAAFEADLQKSPATTSSAPDLAVEFSTFRAFITQSLSLLQQQIEVLTSTVDTIEMQRRRKILLFHGLPEEADENSTQLIVGVVKRHIGIADFDADDIQRCHRMGRLSSSKKPRPLLVKLKEVTTRDKLWFNKTKLKGSGITLSEFLTKRRHDIFMAARDKFGVTNAWTRDGNIFVVSSGVRHRIVSLTMLNQINADVPAKPTPVKKAIAVPKTRRAAATKK